MQSAQFHRQGAQLVVTGGHTEHTLHLAVGSSSMVRKRVRVCVYTWVWAAVTAPILREHWVNCSACCHGADHQNRQQSRNVVFLLWLMHFNLFIIIYTGLIQIPTTNSIQHSLTSKVVSPGRSLMSSDSVVSWLDESSSLVRSVCSHQRSSAPNDRFLLASSGVSTLRRYTFWGTETDVTVVSTAANC